MPSLIPASAMFDLRNKYFRIRGKLDSAEIKKKSNIFIFFRFFGSAGRRNNFSTNCCLIHKHFAKQVFFHICQQGRYCLSVVLSYTLATTTKTKLNIRHSIHVRIQHDKKYITDCILIF